MSTEEFEDTNEIRGFLGEAFGTAEPALADLASGSIARGDRSRRRNQVFVGGGMALSVAAVIGTFAAVAGTTPPAVPKPTVPAATSTTGKPHPQMKMEPVTDQTDKTLDIVMHLPETLQQLLPAGMTVQHAPAKWTQESQFPADFELSNSTGTSELTLDAGQVMPDSTYDKQAYCQSMAPQHGAGTGPDLSNCDIRTLPGGTLYLKHDVKVASSEAGMPGMLKPGHDNDPVWQILRATYIPNDRSYRLTLEETSQVMDMAYADKAPDAYKRIHTEWPPNNGNTYFTGVAPSVLLSGDDIAALIAKPGFTGLEQLLDARTPVSQSTIAERDRRNAQLATLMDPVLPGGLKLGINFSTPAGWFTLTGPTGKNNFYWYTTSQSDAVAAWGGHCDQSQTPNCQEAKVPGGSYMWIGQGGASDTEPTTYSFTFRPDDPAKPALEVMVETNPREPAVTGGPAKASPLQITAGQLAAIAIRADLVDVVKNVNALDR